MSRIDNRSYHEGRARDEMRRAQEATDPAVASIHRELAVLHRRRMMAIVENPAETAPAAALRSAVRGR